MAGSAGPTLHAQTTGESGPRVAFCHGLFGQGRNWNQIAKGLADVCRPTLLDMPNHGRSPWTEEFDYLEAAGLVGQTLRSIDPDDPWVVVGHSMGGKIAMLLALTEPELVERLAVVDISPESTTSFSEFAVYADAMRTMDLEAVDTRQDADAAMREAAPDPGVRGFLLQNLRSKDGGYAWQPNLDLLHAQLPAIGDFPDLAGAQFDGPTLWVGGSRSRYITEDAEPIMRGLFPKVHQITIKGAGHWVHSEKPQEFATILRWFLKR